MTKNSLLAIFWSFQNYNYAISSRHNIQVEAKVIIWDHIIYLNKPPSLICNLGTLPSLTDTYIYFWISSHTWLNFFSMWLITDIHSKWACSDTTLLTDKLYSFHTLSLNSLINSFADISSMILLSKKHA